jgi:hypothetical protein
VLGFVWGREKISAQKIFTIYYFLS